MRAQHGVRRAAPKDLNRILEIERASFGRDAYDCKLFAHYLRRCSDLFLVAVVDGRVCGYLIVCIRGIPGDRAELISLAVDPGQRKGGLASLLLGSALRRIRRFPVERLHLMVRPGNRPAMELYRKYGFRRIRRVAAYYEDGGDGIAMSLVLRPGVTLR